MSAAGKGQEGLWSWTECSFHLGSPASGPRPEGRGGASPVCRGPSVTWAFTHQQYHMPGVRLGQPQGTGTGTGMSGRAGEPRRDPPWLLGPRESSLGTNAGPWGKQSLSTELAKRSLPPYLASRPMCRGSSQWKAWQAQALDSRPRDHVPAPLCLLESWFCLSGSREKALGRAHSSAPPSGEWPLEMPPCVQEVRPLGGQHGTWGLPDSV